MEAFGDTTAPCADDDEAGWCWSKYPDETLLEVESGEAAPVLEGESRGGPAPGDLERFAKKVVSLECRLSPSE